MISIKTKGNFKKTDDFLKKALNVTYEDILRHYGELGVRRLQEYTPIDTGETAYSWYYEIETNRDKSTIRWCNRNIVGDSSNVAVLLQLGHGTKNGGYVQGIDYINPALKPIFDDVANKIFEEVTKI